MAETSPPSPETTGITLSDFNRLRRRTTISLVLSTLILILIVVGAIIHHHHPFHKFHGFGRGGGWCHDSHGPFGEGAPFHRFGGPGWGGQGGFGGGPSSGAPGGPPWEMPKTGGMPGMTQGGPGNPPDPAKMADTILDHLSTQLHLTDDQKAKIKPIIDQQIAELQKRMEAQREAMQKQIEEAKAEIKPLLNADQQKQLDALPLPGPKPAASDAANTSTQKPGP